MGRSQTPMMQVKEMMVRKYVQSQQALMWEHQDQGGGVKAPPLSDSMDVGGPGGALQQNQNLYPGQPYPPYPNQNLLLSPPAPLGPKEQQLSGLQGYGQDMVVPRPPQGRKPLSRQNSLTAAGGSYMGSPPTLSPAHSSFSPTHSSASPRRGVRLPPVQQQQLLPQSEMFSPSNNNNNVYYSAGNAHMEGGSFLNHNMLSTKSAALAPYPEGPVSNALENLDLDNAHIDFASIIDDTESFGSLHGLQDVPGSASSRLTTPQTSVTLAPPGSGLSNMAVGDMTSMLTSLAGENKYLNTLS